MKLLRVLLPIGMLLLMVTTTRSDTGMMSVQVRDGQIRSTPSFLGQIVGPVSYGDRVETFQQQGDWIEVDSPKKQRGWLHQSALTKKQIVMGAGGQTATSAASGQEIALAGKGFNADVESRYRGAHKNIDFTWVDRMEMVRISQDEMARFLKDGAIKPEGGAK